ncbi:MAG: NF038143 family protein [Pseudomonadota bacterium]
MGNLRVIWKHEVRQADKIARSLLETRRAKVGWKIFVLPFLLYDYISFRKTLIPTRKNILFTKRLAFNAATEILRGKERALEIRLIEIDTRKILDKERKGYYTEKVRRKQLHEIELLLDHYLDLANSNGTTYEDMVKLTYQSEKGYLSFLSKLHQTERDVIHAAVTTMRRGSKRGRESWFATLDKAIRQVRQEEVERIFLEA